MKLNIFKRTKVENSIDFDSMDVALEKSKVTLPLSEIVTKYDAILNMHGYANGDHLVKIGEDEMSVNDLVKKHMEMCNSEKERLEKEQNAGEGEPGMDIEGMENDEDEVGTEESGEADVDSRGGDKHMNEDGDMDEDDKKKDKKMNALKLANAKKAAIKEKVRTLKNANIRDQDEEVATVDLASDKVARGQSRYGSN